MRASPAPGYRPRIGYGACLRRYGVRGGWILWRWGGSAAPRPCPSGFPRFRGGRLCLRRNDAAWGDPFAGTCVAGIPRPWIPASAGMERWGDGFFGDREGRRPLALAPLDFCLRRKDAAGGDPFAGTCGAGVPRPWIPASAGMEKWGGWILWRWGGWAAPRPCPSGFPRFRGGRLCLRRNDAAGGGIGGDRATTRVALSRAGWPFVGTMGGC